jgi:hypothetical protein
MYAQAAVKPNTLLRNGAYGIVMRGVQKCTRGCSSLRGRKTLPLCCIKLATATDPTSGSGGMFVQSVAFVENHSGNINNISIYGFELVEYVASLYNCDIEIIDNTEKSEQQELVEDLVQIITVFSCKLQGKRANKARKLVNELIEVDSEK